MRRRNPDDADSRSLSRAPARSSPRSRAFVGAHALWLGVGGVAVAAAAFLLHQLMAWPPHEDETLALFVGRDSLGGRRRARHPRPRRRAAPLPLRLGGRPSRRSGSAACGSSRRRSRSRACRSSRCSADGSPDRCAALVATALVAGSWVFLFHGVYGRMYSLFLFLSLLVVRRSSCARSTAGRGALGALGRRDPARASRAPLRRARARRPGRVRARRAARPAARRRWSPFAPWPSSASRSGSPTSCSPAGSTSASAAAARSSAGPWAIARTSGGRAGDFSTRLVAGARRRRSLLALVGLVHACARRRGRSRSAWSACPWPRSSPRASAARRRPSRGT